MKLHKTSDEKFSIRMKITNLEVFLFWTRSVFVFLLSLGCLCFGVSLVATVSTIAGIPFVFFGTLLTVTSFLLLYTRCWIACSRDQDVKDMENRATDYPPPYRQSWIGLHLDGDDSGSSTEVLHTVIVQDVRISEECLGSNLPSERRGESAQFAGRDSESQSHSLLDNISVLSSDDFAATGPSGRKSSCEFQVGRSQESSLQISRPASCDLKDCQQNARITLHKPQIGEIDQVIIK